MPYTTIEDLRSPGLGLINESDAWLTGRPYGLPGTATVRMSMRPGGYRSPAGYHYDAAMVGGGFGDNLGQDSAVALQLQQLVETQKAQTETAKKQQASLERIAFWQALSGGILVGTLILGAAVGIASAVKGER